jgi:hypothetical protein
MRTRGDSFRHVFLAFLAPLVAGVALAQDIGQAPPGGGGQTVTATDSKGNVINVTGTITPPVTETTTTYVPPPGTPSEGYNPDAHLPSSSQSITDISRSQDGFDLVGPRGEGGVVRGREGGTAIIRRAARTPGGPVPSVHQVRRGDTLWDLSAGYYNNPWMWPKIWSYNPQIQNPHWIYPGDQIRMRSGSGGGEGGGFFQGAGGLGRGGGAGGPGGTGGPGGPGAGEGGFTDRRMSVPRQTVFLRNLGYIDDPKKDIWGELVGSREEQMLLAQGNNVYMKLRPGVPVELGQTLSIFHQVRPPKNVPGARKLKGDLVSFKGAVRIDQWNPKTRVARGRIIESIDVVERGARVGPVGRRFDVVEPRRNEANVWARVLTGFYPHEIMGQHQVVFIDRGEKDGLRPGNRLFIVQRGDSWRKTLKTATKMARGRVRTDVPEHVQVEYTPISGKDEDFPEEIVAELRVLRTKPYTSLTVVTMSHREIEPGDRAVARKGY